MQRTLSIAAILVMFSLHLGLQYQASNSVSLVFIMIAIMMIMDLQGDVSHRVGACNALISTQHWRYFMNILVLIHMVTSWYRIGS